MNIGAYGILIIFGAFVLLMIINPKLSCFGKRIKSPLYPLLRKRGQSGRKPLRTEDYDFNLGGSKEPSATRPRPHKPAGNDERIEDYGFNLQSPDKNPPTSEAVREPDKKGVDGLVHKQK